MKGEKTDIESAGRHLQRMRELLRMEYDCEKAEFERQTQTMGVERMVRKGLAWYPVAIGRNYYNSLNQLILEVTRRNDDEIDHSFEFGRPVCFFSVSGDGAVRYLPVRATVSFADDERMAIAMADNGSIATVCSVDRLGVQLYFDETSYQAMFSALAAVESAKNNRLAELRDILIGTVRPGFRDLFPMRFPWLNVTQEQAVNRVLAARDVAIVHGPPGTGKTTTLVEAIYETLHREPQVLVCAQSNTAVDWISERLVDRGVNVLRIGNPSRVDDKMLSFTYERRFESHPRYPELWALRRDIRQLQGKRRRNADEREAIGNRISRLKDRAQALEIEINADLFRSANVIASTLVSSNHRLLYGHHFSTLFIDEAAQALEAACWIAIRKADRVILAGDHQQLPPTIKSYEAQRAGLDRTLMETIVARHPEAVTLLKMQYRMSRPIMQFSSDWFYGGMVKAAPEVEHRSILDMDNAITWIDTSELAGLPGMQELLEGEERAGSLASSSASSGSSGLASFRESTTDGGSRMNAAEGRLLIAALEVYAERIGIQRIIDENIDFAIISPYRAQVQYLRGLLRRSAFLRKIKGAITVNTVDGFQGQERDVVFISLVRANDGGRIGFLSDLRRMNVAMTRARMKLVILGDSPTLTTHPFYRKLMEYISDSRTQ